MRITLMELDDTIRSYLKDMIKTEVMRVHKTLPLDTQEDMILSVLTDDFMQLLCMEVIKYYACFAERETECELTQEDCVNIYFNRA